MTLTSIISRKTNDVYSKSGADIGPDGKYNNSGVNVGVAVNTLYEKLVRPPLRYAGGVARFGDSVAAERGEKTRNFIEYGIARPGARHAWEDVISPAGRYTGGILGIGDSTAAERGKITREFVYDWVIKQNLKFVGGFSKTYNDGSTAAERGNVTRQGLVSAGKFYRRNWILCISTTAATGAAVYTLALFGDAPGYANVVSTVSLTILGGAGLRTLISKTKKE